MTCKEEGKVFGPYAIFVEVWRCLGERALDFLSRLFATILETERMSDKERRSVLVLILKIKDSLI